MKKEKTSKEKWSHRVKTIKFEWMNERRPSSTERKTPEEIIKERKITDVLATKLKNMFKINTNKEK